MKLVIYKGFSAEFLSKVAETPLLPSSIPEKKDILHYSVKLKRQINAAVLAMDDDDVRWLTYEEYAYAHEQIELAASEYSIELVLYKNNLMPDYYPIEFPVSETLQAEIVSKLDSDDCSETSPDCTAFLAVYSALAEIDGQLYGSFYNYETEKEKAIRNIDFYPAIIQVSKSSIPDSFILSINDNVEDFLRTLKIIEAERPSAISFSRANTEMSKRLEHVLMAYAVKNQIQLADYHENHEPDSFVLLDLINIAKNDIGIPGFTGFRKIKFYKDPDLSKEVVEISQSQIISDIIEQAENAYDDGEIASRDIFITAFTGAGKSVMFQVPAVYLAKKYKKLTIIIEPVKSLMQDQKEQLNKRGYHRVETFNSDLITQTEKEQVLARVKNGEVDLLYLSPETLLSYSMETIIGDREIGLIIIDEAHIVTTWGVGFRPDYWYLGAYLNRLRHPPKVRQNDHTKVHHFPLCAFTATAVHSGIDDSVSETIISLYMENPIKYLGYIKRDNINFQINIRERQKIPNERYEISKAQDLNAQAQCWIRDGKKTIVYFPYASYARDAQLGVKSFSDTHLADSRIDLYTGRDVDELGREAFALKKKETFEKFRKGQILVMMATKAFGMGVDVDDIENVYHYAATGNLSDYVQEIGRVARKQGMTGTAITDYYYNDISFMERLFGMSQIKQYQVRKVLEGIYEVYRTKKNARSFLISPEAFTYIFVSKNASSTRGQEASINQLKTCLLMLEKDFYEKFNFKVLLSRPQSVFTKAFVVVDKSHAKQVLSSKYGKYLSFVEVGREREYNPYDGSLITDLGDVYTIDLKAIWEDYYGNISFPQFKYWYFNMRSTSENKVDVLSEIKDYIFQRQKVTIEAKGDLILDDIRPKILEDFSYIAEVLYSKYNHAFFTTAEFANAISSRFTMTKARIIANSLFMLVDPEGRCVKHRTNGEEGGNSAYILSNGTFGEIMKKAIMKSPLMSRFNGNPNTVYAQYMQLNDDGKDSVALKLLSIFDYISYEVIGGEQPEIFIRLNDPNKVRQIILGQIKYTNGYVQKAKQKHDRDVKVLRRFFTELQSDTERWNFIEDYFLGNDVLSMNRMPMNIQKVKLSAAIDKEKSYPATSFREWNDLKPLLEDALQPVISEFITKAIPMPEYLNAELKKTTFSSEILMAWPDRNVLLFSEPLSEQDQQTCTAKGWSAYDVMTIDYDQIKKELE